MKVVQKAPAGKAILMSTNNIGFDEDLTKIIFELSSNKHLICPNAHMLVQLYHPFSPRLKAGFLMNHFHVLD